MKDKNGEVLNYGDIITNGNGREYKVVETDRIWAESVTTTTIIGPVWFHETSVTKVNPVLDRFGTQINVGYTVYSCKYDAKGVVQRITGMYVDVENTTWNCTDLVVCK